MSEERINPVGKTIAYIHDAGHDVTFFFTDGTFVGVGVQDEETYMFWFDSVKGAPHALTHENLPRN
jgi:hypothetical protein